jgi:uncharacterized membrane protein
MHDPKEGSVVAVYDSHTSAELAIRSLTDAGIDPGRLSIVGKDSLSQAHAAGVSHHGERLRFWGARGALWGSLFGTLMGGAFVFIPAIGPIIVMGPLVGWVLGAIEGAAVGVLGAALTSAGVPKESIAKYEQEVQAGNFLVLAHGNAALIEHAHVVLGPSTPRHLQAHAA